MEELDPPLLPAGLPGAEDLPPEPAPVEDALLLAPPADFTFEAALPVAARADAALPLEPLLALPEAPFAALRLSPDPPDFLSAAASPA